MEFPSRRAAVGFAAGLGALLVVMFADPLFVSKTFSGRDLVPFFLPIEKAVHESWREGKIPLLLRDVSFGRPLAANPNTGAFYPLRIAMAAVPFPFAFKVFPVLHLWIAGVGAFVLAGSLGLSPAACALAGSAFALSGPAISEIVYPNVLPGLGLFPWVVWAGGRLSRTGALRRVAVFGALWGVDLLAGDVFTAGLALLGALLLILQDAAPGEAPRRIRTLFAALVPGFLLAGIQVVPALLFVPETVRALGRFPLRAATMWSVPPWRLLEMILPFPFGNAAVSSTVWGETLWSQKTAGFFQTLSPGVFAAAALFFFRPPRGRRLLVYGLVGTSFAAATLGSFLPPAWLSLSSPIPLRYPEKFMVGAALGIALLAGFGFDSLRAGRAAPAAVGVFGVALALLAASVVAAADPSSVAAFVDRHWSATLKNGSLAARQLPGMLAEAAGLWAALGLIFAWCSRRRAALAVLFVFSIADLAVLRWRAVGTDSERAVLTTPPSARAILRLPESDRFGFFPVEEYYRSAGGPGRSGDEKARDALKSDVGAAFGVSYSFNQDYDVSDFYRVELARREIYRDFGLWPGLRNFLGAYSARAAIVERGRIPNGFPVVTGKVIGPEWAVLNPAALPAFRLATRVVEVHDVGQAYDRIHGGRADLRWETVVETGRSAEEQLAGGTVALQRENADSVVVLTRSPGPSRLVFPLAFFPFRSVSVDGRPVSVDPANLCLSSVAVPAGAHRILIREQLPGGAAGPAATLAGAVLAFVCYKETKES
ncbi:MAG: hypothetical protein ACRD16_15345 [Thermoanaerobaculia bacterium]